KKKYALVLQTNCGSFVIALDQTLAPHTVASLVSLARAGFYDGTIFHRIVPGFVIQGGDPTQTGAGGPGYKTVDRPPASARYVKGVVAMAKTQLERPGTSGSQFFVVTAADAGLTPDYAIDARVVHCADWERGPGASLRCGLAGVPSGADAAVVVLADGPQLDPRAIDRVIAAWRASGADVVAATYGGVRLHPVLLARPAWAR